MIAEYLHRVRAQSRDVSWPREIAKWAATTAAVPLEIGRARRLAAHAGELKLHLGCADTYLPGWINVDLMRPGRRLDLGWDSRRRHPWGRVPDLN